jgi:hypothetical protein
MPHMPSPLALRLQMNGKYTPRRATETERDLVDGIRGLLNLTPLYEKALQPPSLLREYPEHQPYFSDRSNRP